MAVLFMDGFDLYQTGTDDLTPWNTPYNKWTNGLNSYIYGSIQTGGARYGTGNSLHLWDNSYIYKDFSNTYNTLVVGMGLYTTSTLWNNTLNAEARQIVSFYDASSGVVSKCSLWLEGTGHLTLITGSTWGAGNIIEQNSVTTLIGVNVWYFLEIKVTFGSNAAYEVKIDEQTVLQGTGNTTNTGNDYASRVQLGGVDPTFYYDDFYVLDTSGTVANDFLGDTRIQTIGPDNDNDVHLDPSTGSVNYQLVDDVPVNTVDYVSSNVPNEYDIYGLSDLSYVPLSIHGIQTTVVANKDNSGNRSVKPLVKTGATTVEGPAHILSSTWQGFYDVWTVNPATGVAWTGLEINGLESGTKVI